MKKSVLIVFGGAVGVAMLAAFMVQMSLGGKQQAPVQIQQEARVEVLVAGKNLPMGTDLANATLRWQSWPKATLFNGAVVREGDQSASTALEGRLRRDIAQGEPIVLSALLSESKGNFVAAKLEAGQRAIAIKVSAESMVGGFLEPGDFVDVILTYKESIRTGSDEDPRLKKLIELNLDKLAAETILQHIRVLAVDQKAKRPEEGKIKVGKTVTLAVNARDAEKLALAGQLGELTLSLRGIGDEQMAEEKWPTITDARLTSIGDEIFRKSQEIIKTSGGSGNKNTLRIFSGSAVNAVSVR